MDTTAVLSLARGRFIPVPCTMLASLLWDGTAVVFDQLSRKTKLLLDRHTHRLLPYPCTLGGVTSLFASSLGLECEQFRWGSRTCLIKHSNNTESEVHPAFLTTQFIDSAVEVFL